MYKLTAWIKENGAAIRYIRQAETISELWEILVIDVDLTNLLEIHISQEI